MRFISKPYKVLVIDDDKDDYFLIKNYLDDLGEGDYLVDWASNYNEGLEQICNKAYSIYLIDHLLGPKTGLELIEQAVAEGYNLPMILLTGMGDRELDIKAIRAGADDYLPKMQLNTELLERTLRHALQRYDLHLMNEEQMTRFKTLFEQSIDPIYIISGDWYLIEANKSFLQLFGLTTETLRAKKFSGIFKNTEEYNRFVTLNKENGFVKNYNAELNVGNDKTIIALISSSPLLDYQGEISGYQGIIHDITQLRKAEQELILADQMSLTGRMARMIAHEVRNPLTNITLATDQLNDTWENGDTEEKDLYTNMIKRNTDRINNLINDLLNSTKLAVPNFVEFPVEKLVESALVLCYDRINLKNIVVNKNGFDTQTNLLVDPEKLKIAFVNIITNCIEAMEETRAAQLELSCRRGDGQFEITISDNGKGMDEETQRNLFKAFFTVRSGGMGLGMTTVQNIIYTHKGEIKVKSKPNKGSSFTILLPISAA